MNRESLNKGMRIYYKRNANIGIGKNKETKQEKGNSKYKSK